jgi:preprotein translocase SecF subunit
MEVKDLSGPADLSDMREKLGAAGLGEVSLQGYADPADVQIRLQYQEPIPADFEEATRQLKEANSRIQPDELAALLPERATRVAQDRAQATVVSALGENFRVDKHEYVGPEVGSELIQDAIIATVLALLGIMAYVWFRYEWQFAVNCIVALFHDCITTVGLFALLGLQFDLTVVAAVLTIAGFSVNDTVVIYDRIREELRRYKKMPLPDLLNMSINRTLSRTTMTSGLAFLAVLALFLFGGEVLQGFSTAMIWGIVAGTYSTIFVAAPMLVYMGLRRDRVAGEKPAETEPAPKGA